MRQDRRSASPAAGAAGRWSSSAVGLVAPGRLAGTDDQVAPSAAHARWSTARAGGPGRHRRAVPRAEPTTERQEPRPRRDTCRAEHRPRPGAPRRRPRRPQRRRWSRGPRHRCTPPAGRGRHRALPPSARRRQPTEADTAAAPPEAERETAGCRRGPRPTPARDSAAPEAERETAACRRRPSRSDPGMRGRCRSGLRPGGAGAACAGTPAASRRRWC